MVYVSSSAEPERDVTRGSRIERAILDNRADTGSVSRGVPIETQDVIANAKAKLKAKGMDWIAANDVSPETRVFGGDSNTVHLATPGSLESWPQMSKDEVAERLMVQAAEHLRRTTAAAE